MRHDISHGYRGHTMSVFVNRTASGPCGDGYLGVLDDCDGR